MAALAPCVHPCSVEALLCCSPAADTRTCRPVHVPRSWFATHLAGTWPRLLGRDVLPAAEPRPEVSLALQPHSLPVPDTTPFPLTPVPGVATPSSGVLGWAWRAQCSKMCGHAVDGQCLTATQLATPTHACAAVHAGRRSPFAGTGQGVPSSFRPTPCPLSAGTSQQRRSCGGTSCGGAPMRAAPSASPAPTCRDPAVQHARNQQNAPVRPHALHQHCPLCLASFIHSALLLIPW